MVMAGEPRLRFHLISEGAVWYHHEPARNHVLIDSQAAARALAPGFVRPIELWRAPRWQRPTSAAVVRYAETETEAETDLITSPDTHSGLESDEPPAVGDVINRSAVVDFVGDVSAFRLGTLGALIDAVAAAMDGGPPVVLATSSVDAGALWIGAVSFFAPPATSLRLSFSTHERLDDVLTQLARERRPPAAEGWRTPLLSVVPQADVDRLSRRDDLPVVVVDPRVEATLVAVGGVDHRQTHLGQQIRVTDWSRLALDVCCEEFTVLERCLNRLDEVSLATPPAGGERGEWWPVRVGDQVQLQRAAGPAWPLAAAVMLTGDLPLALPTATRVILRDTPSTVRLSPELASSVASLVAATVDDAEQAWSRLQAALAGAPPRSALIEAAFESYLRLALGDDDWLLRQPPPLPPSVPVDPALAGRLRAPLTGLVDRLTADQPVDVRYGVLLLRAVDFAHRMVRLLGGPDPAGAGLARLAVRAVEVLLESDTGAKVGEIAGPLDGVALARWIVPAVAQQKAGWPSSTSPVGERLPASVIALLAGAIDAGRLATVGRAEALAAEPVALEVAIATATGRIAGDQRLRGPAVEYLLDQAARAYPDADAESMVGDVFGRLVDDPWTAAGLLHVVERAPAALGAHLVPIGLRHLPEWADDPQSGRLAAALLKRVEFLPRRGVDGQLRPRRAGTTDEQAQLLNLLAATGEGWLTADDGLHRRAAEILMWADRAWPGADQQVRRLIAPRITVAAFQVALAAEPAQAGTVLRSRLAVVPIGSAWRAAIPVGVEPALPMVAQVLRLNRYRLAGELVEASTRSMLDPPPDLGELPRLPMLPVGPMLRWLVGHENSPELNEHLAALVDQVLRAHEGPFDRAGLLAFWDRALPGVPLGSAESALEQLRHPALTGVLQVALGAGPEPGGGGALGGGFGAGLAALLSGPVRREVEARREPEAVPARPASIAEFGEAAKSSGRSWRRPGWWRRWVAGERR
jgi:GTPase-associated protein 1, middle domain